MKQTIIIRSATQLAAFWAKAQRWELVHPVQLVISHYKPTRSNEQNRKMWAMLSDIARQIVWHGRKLTAENWKDILTASLYGQDVVPGLDGNFVVLGRSTRKMSTVKMSELIEFMYAFGAQDEHLVEWTEVEEAA